MLSRLLVVLLAAVQASTALAQPAVFNYPQDLQQPSAELLSTTAAMSEVTVLRGKFQQTKQITVLSRPLISTGQFMSVKARGLLWQTVQPVKSTYLISPQGIKNIAADTAIPGGGFSQSLGGVFSALISGDLLTLKQFFNVYFYQSEIDADWSIGLIPHKESLIAKGIASIILTGDEYVQAISIDEVSGDTTKIVFSALQTEPATLSSMEEQYFAK